MVTIGQEAAGPAPHCGASSSYRPPSLQVSVQCAVCSVQCAVCSVQCAVCSVQWAAGSGQCGINTKTFQDPQLVSCQGIGGDGPPPEGY